MSSNAHHKLVNNAKNAINAVYSDKSVDATTTLDSLEILTEEVEAYIGAIKEMVKGG